MKNLKDELVKSVKYVVPVIFVFIGILTLNNYDKITSFLSDNLVILGDLLAPFFVGFIIAYLLNQPIKKLEERFNTKRGLSLIIIYGFAILILVFSWLFIVPIIKSNINDLAHSIPKGIDQVQHLINNIFTHFKFDITNPDIKQQITNFITEVLVPLSTFIASSVSNFVLSIMNTIVPYTINIVLGLVISVYLLLSKEKYLEVSNLFFNKLLRKYYPTAKEFVNKLDANIGVYIMAKAVDSTIYGVICTVALALVGSKYAIFIGVAAGITNMIPFFGPILGTVIGVVVNLFFSVEKAILVLVVMVIIQQIESTVLEPHFVGKQVGVPPILTMFAVTFAGKYAGFLGILLAVPVTGVLLIYLKRYIYSNKESNLAS